MISQCPKCHTRLTDFAVACNKCDWSIVDSASSALNGNLSDGNGSAAIAPLAPGEEPPIVIVKNFAKTKAPPPPEEKATDDILPAEITGEPVEQVAPLEVDLQIQRAMDYIESSGGFTPQALTDRIILLHANGEVSSSKNPIVNRGDEIIVLPKVPVKNLQVAATIVDIVYKVAIAASVALSL